MMERGMFALLRAINYESPPCGDCNFYTRCSRGRIACETFRGYVNNSNEAGLNPTRKIYMDIYHGKSGIN
jgi:hypothetical protein